VEELRTADVTHEVYQADIHSSVEVIQVDLPLAQDGSNRSLRMWWRKNWQCLGGTNWVTTNVPQLIWCQWLSI